MRTFTKTFFLFFFFAGSSLHAQNLINTLIVFCNDGEKFTVILDGIKRNQEPSTNVKIPNLDQKKYAIKVIFDSKKMNDVDDVITFLDNGYECSFELNGLKHHKHKLHYLSSNSIAGFVHPDNTNSNNTTNTSNTNIQQKVDTIKQPPPEAPSGNPMDGGMDQNINIGGKKGGIKVNQNGVIQLNPGNGNVGVSIKKHPKANCPNPVTKEEFDAFKENMKKQATEADKELIGNAFIENNCLLSSQVKEAMGLFKTERSSIDFAKKSYSFTKDFEKFSITIDGVVTQSGKDELKKYIDEHK